MFLFFHCTQACVQGTEVRSFVMALRWGLVPVLSEHVVCWPKRLSRPVKTSDNYMQSNLKFYCLCQALVCGIFVSGEPFSDSRLHILGAQVLNCRNATKYQRSSAFSDQQHTQPEICK